MKINKSNIVTLIFGFIMGALLSGTIVYAVNISSANVDYNNTNSGIEATTVEGALDELYQDASKKMAINTFGEAMYSESLGAKVNGRGTSLSLSRGKYFITASNEYGGGSSTNTAYTQNSGLNISCGNCNIVFLSGRHKQAKGSSHGSDNIILNYYVEVYGDSDTISIYYTTSNNSAVAHAVALQAIPINE